MLCVRVRVRVSWDTLQSAVKGWHGYKMLIRFQSTLDIFYPYKESRDIKNSIFFLTMQGEITIKDKLSDVDEFFNSRWLISTLT